MTVMEQHNTDAAREVECFKCHGSGKVAMGLGMRLEAEAIVETSYPAEAQFTRNGKHYKRTWFGDKCEWCNGTGKRIEQDGKQYAPQQICGHPMFSDFAHRKQDRVCVMDKNHRGRHASYGVFTCGACGKRRRSSPYENTEELGPLCFMCASPQLRDDHYPEDYYV